jgi:hypothetical protein
MFKKIAILLMVASVLLTPALTFADHSAGHTGFGVGELPTGTGTRENEGLLDFISAAIRTVLGVVGAILLLLIIYGGFTYATAAGAEEKVKKGRQILTYAIIGIVIIAVAWILTDYVIGQFLGGGNINP